MRPTTQETIEILSSDLLNQYRPLVNELRRLAAALKLEFGWHYLLDLCWIINRLGALRGLHILEAGAGTGMLQWYLATYGVEVLSVDRADRACLPLRFRRRFQVRGLRPGNTEDLAGLLPTMWDTLRGAGSLPARIYHLGRDLAGWLTAERSIGRIIFYNQDLRALSDIPSYSMDAVVALSSLEHNSVQDLPLVVRELMRVLKPGGVLLATLGAARDQDWFHQPSQGWCFSEKTLRQCFSLDNNVSSNYKQYDEYFNGLRNCEELRDNLAGFYFRSGDNGMPWGKWDPQYQSVGVCKVKAGGNS